MTLTLPRKLSAFAFVCILTMIVGWTMAADKIASIVMGLLGALSVFTTGHAYAQAQANQVTTPAPAPAKAPVKLVTPKKDEEEGS